MTLSTEKQFVILLHGLGRTRHSMRKIDQALSDAGFKTRNTGYPSTRLPVEQLSEQYVSDAVAYCHQQQASKIHFVTHSLGGILVRQYLQSQTLPVGSRIVMISPPNRGSEIANFLKPFPPYRWILGPAALQLDTTDGSLPNKMQAIQYEIGIIAGNKSSDPWFSPFIRGENDGKVSVENTKLHEMKDFVVVNSGHTLIMRSPTTIRQILAFLSQAKFIR